METKKCTKCGEVKELGDYEKAKANKDGLKGQCRSCVIEYRKEYRFKSSDKIKVYCKRYYLKNTDKVKQGNKKCQLKNPEKIKDCRKKWQLKNPEKYKDSIKKNQLKFRNDLYDCYIKTNLKRKGFTSEQITPELIEVQRLIIKTKRLCKTSQI